MRRETPMTGNITERCQDDQPCPLSFFLCLGRGIVLALLPFPVFRDQDPGIGRGTGLNPQHLDQDEGRPSVPPWEDSNTCPCHGTSSSAENGTITELSRGGAPDHRDFLLPGCWRSICWEVRKVPTVTQAPGSSPPPASSPCSLLFSLSLLWDK